MRGFHRFNFGLDPFGFGGFDAQVELERTRPGLSDEMISARMQSVDRIDLLRYANASWFYEKLLARSYWVPVPYGQDKPRCMGLYTLEGANGKWVVAFGDAYLAQAHLSRAEYEPKELPCAKLGAWCLMQGVDGLLILESTQRALALTQFELRFLSEGDLPPETQQEEGTLGNLPEEWALMGEMSVLSTGGLSETADLEQEHPLKETPPREIRPLDIGVFGSLQQDIQCQCLLARSILDSLYLFARTNDQGDALEQELIPYQICLGVCLKGDHREAFQVLYANTLLSLLSEAGLEQTELLYLDEMPPLWRQVKAATSPLVQF